VADAFLASGLNCLLFIVDNSSNRDLEDICTDDRIEYIHNGSNLGFGKAHNIAIRKAISMDIAFHFILNPDVNFKPEIIVSLIDKIKSDPVIGAIMPKVLNLDQSVQYLPKLLPSPWLLLIRVFRPLRAVLSGVYNNHVLKNKEDTELNVPSLSGCFCLYKLSVLNDVGLFNESFFMYFEDTELSRRIHRDYKTLYYPSVAILHGHGRGAAKDFRLFRIFMKSAITYFNMYGWVFDKERRQINQKVLRQLRIESENDTI
jgi:GT2 family glycosyltransferase